MRKKGLGERCPTSQWSGRLRAAHFGAAHRRVRRRIRKLTILTSPNLTNQVQAQHRHAAFEMGFALHFIGARRDDRVGIDKKN